MNRRQFACGAAFAAANLGDIRWAGAAATVRAIRGDAFVNGVSEIRLVDVVAPAPLDPFGAQATLALNSIISSGKLEIADAAPTDRWGRRLARVSLAGEAGQTVQESLVAIGAVRVRPESDADAFLDSLLTAETAARAAKRGLWGHWSYRVYSAADANAAVGAFGIVEGNVLQAIARQGRIYVNFGGDYRTDFTITAKSRDAKKWAKRGLDLLAQAGARIRVRGYVAWINGPSIELSHRRQVEVLAPADAAIAKTVE
jgi:endonuclease YncB( thermonuclease family)